MNQQTETTVPLLPIETSINQTRLEITQSNLDESSIPQPKSIYRKVHLNNHKRGSNLTINSKYNFLTFLPLVLYQQFKYFFNLYFLGLTITQFIPVLRVGFLFNYVGPLSLVLTLSMCKEAYDDILRHARDKAINNQHYTILTKERGPITVPCSQLKVGMIIHIGANERIPADILVLTAKDEDGHSFKKLRSQRCYADAVSARLAQQTVPG